MCIFPFFSDQFRGFKIYIEYIPVTERERNAYMPAEQKLCYQHNSNSAITSEEILVHCTHTHQGNTARIALDPTYGHQLVLCDVNVNGGKVKLL